MSNKYERDFNSVDDFVEASIKPECGNLGRQSREFSSSFAWDYNSGYEGALEMARFGWGDGRKRVSEMSEKLFDIIKPQSHMQDVTYQLDGGTYIDVGRYVEGEPECFGDFTTPENPTKVIRIEIGGSISHGISAETVISRGSAVAALIDLLEIRGYRCELAVCIAVEESGSQHLTTIKVKEARQPVDIDRLAFCLAHPSFLRRVWFGFIETEKEEIRKCFKFYKAAGDAYGSPINETTSDCDIYIPIVDGGNHEDFQNNNSCIKWIREIIEKHQLIKEEVEI